MLFICPKHPDMVVIEKKISFSLLNFSLKSPGDMHWVDQQPVVLCFKAGIFALSTSHPQQSIQDLETETFSSASHSSENVFIYLKYHTHKWTWDVFLLHFSPMPVLMRNFAYWNIITTQWQKKQGEQSWWAERDERHRLGRMKVSMLDILRIV